MAGKLVSVVVARIARAVARPRLNLGWNRARSACESDIAGRLKARSARIRVNRRRPLRRQVEGASSCVRVVEERIRELAEAGRSRGRFASRRTSLRRRSWRVAVLAGAWRWAPSGVAVSEASAPASCPAEQRLADVDGGESDRRRPAASPTALGARRRCGPASRPLRVQPTRGSRTPWRRPAGLSGDAAPEAVNLARKVADGEQIVIPDTGRGRSGRRPRRGRRRDSVLRPGGRQRRAGGPQQRVGGAAGHAPGHRAGDCHEDRGRQGGQRALQFSRGPRARPGIGPKKLGGNSRGSSVSDEAKGSFPLRPSLPDARLAGRWRSGSVWRSPSAHSGRRTRPVEPGPADDGGRSGRRLAAP